MTKKSVIFKNAEQILVGHVAHVPDPKRVGVGLSKLGGMWLRYPFMVSRNHFGVMLMETAIEQSQFFRIDFRVTVDLFSNLRNGRRGAFVPQPVSFGVFRPNSLPIIIIAVCNLPKCWCLGGNCAIKAANTLILIQTLPSSPLCG